MVLAFPQAVLETWTLNLDFNLNVAVLACGRGLKGRGAPIGFIWAEFQLKRSHGDPFRDQNHDVVRPVLPWF